MLSHKEYVEHFLGMAIPDAAVKILVNHWNLGATPSEFACQREDSYYQWLEGNTLHYFPMLKR